MVYGSRKFLTSGYVASLIVNGQTHWMIEEVHF